MSSLRSRVKSPKANLSFSPDVAQDLRHRCRNPRCRCKLPVPTDNPRNAFCTRGCFTSFYRSKCLVCEQPMERKQENQLTCGKNCGGKLQRDRSRFFAKWGQIPPTLQHPLENPVNTGTKTAHKPGRAWRQVAGLAMSSVALRLATVGPDLAARLEREQRAAIEVHLHDPDEVRAAERETAYVAMVKRGRPVPAPALRIPTSCDWEPASNIDPASVPGIPAFLRRGKESTS
jgi:hypothetical protein